MRPKMFIGSSAERMELARAAQEDLEDDVEVTIWTQGVFSPSLTNLQSIAYELQASDFGLFIFAPDDVSTIRNTTSLTVRDNVVFELGMFVGRLGIERCFLITPRGSHATLHLPTDLLGVVRAEFDADRQDGNLVAALGPACNRIRRSVRALGRMQARQVVEAAPDAPPEHGLISDPQDCLAVLISWMGSRPHGDNSKAIAFSEVDRELGLTKGSTAAHIEEAARHWRYRVARRGPSIILFEEERYSGGPADYF